MSFGRKIGLSWPVRIQDSHPPETPCQNTTSMIAPGKFSDRGMKQSPVRIEILKRIGQIAGLIAICFKYER